MPRLVIALCALLSLVCTGLVHAADATPLSVSIDLYALIAETSLVSVEQEPEKHAANAKDIVDRLDSTLPTVVTAIAGNDTNRVAELTMQWQDLKSAYGGEQFAMAFREATYDTNVSARYTAGVDALLMALDAPATAEAAPSPTRQLRLEVLKVVAAYLRLTTGIVGGTSFSANDTDNDIPTGVARIDAQLAALRRAVAGTPQAPTLRLTIARWHFIRTVLLDSKSQASPFIVYKEGLAIDKALAGLDSGVAAAK